MNKGGEPSRWKSDNGNVRSRSRLRDIRQGLGLCRVGIRWAFRPLITARQIEWGPISSAVDLVPRPNNEIIEISLRAAYSAWRADLSAVEQRAVADKEHVLCWPGEHYKLLAGLAKVLAPSRVVEIGTFTGLSALALLSALPDNARLISYDVIPWSRFPDTSLRESDFSAGFEQRVGDLSDPDYFRSQAQVLAEADLIFIDGPKDGSFERKFLSLSLPLIRDCVLVFDDIRLPTMVGLWRDLPLPKMDVTSLGHYTGTGIALAGSEPSEL